MLYLLTPKPMYEDYFNVFDACNKMVVRVNTALEARKIASRHVHDEGRDDENIWEKEKYTNCEPLTDKEENGLICQHVNYG